MFWRKTTAREGEAPAEPPADRERLENRRVRPYSKNFAITALLLLAATTGCGRKDPPATPPPAKAAPAPKATTPPATKVSNETPAASPTAARGVAPTDSKPKAKPKDEAPSLTPGST